MDTQKGEQNMRQRNFRRSFLGLMALLALVFSLALVGCDDDGGGGDDLEATDLAGRTFNFPGLGALNPNLANVPATLVFGAAVGDTLPFTLTVAGNTIRGTATVTSIEFLIVEINGSITAGTFVTINGDPDDVTFTVGDTFEIDADIERRDDADIITFSNPDTGDSIDFEFPPGETGATGSTGG
jgi:hypothetical protein